MHRVSTSSYRIDTPIVARLDRAAILIHMFPKIVTCVLQRFRFVVGQRSERISAGLWVLSVGTLSSYHLHHLLIQTSFTYPDRVKGVPTGLLLTGLYNGTN